MPLNWGTVSHAKIVKQCIPQNSVLDRVTIMSLLTHFDFTSVQSHNIATCNTHSFLLLYLNFHVFFCIHCKWLKFRKDERIFCSYLWRLDYYIIHQSVGYWWVITTKLMNRYIFLIKPFLISGLEHFFSGEKLAMYWSLYFSHHVGNHSAYLFLTKLLFE